MSTDRKFKLEQTFDEIDSQAEVGQFTEEETEAENVEEEPLS